MKKVVCSVLIALAILAGLFGCAPQAVAPEVTEAPVTLKIVALPILDALPIFVAQDQGLFAKNNVTVEFIPAGSAPERDQLIASGQADGMVNEVLISPILQQRRGARADRALRARRYQRGGPVYLAGRTAERREHRRRPEG